MYLKSKPKAGKCATAKCRKAATERHLLRDRAPLPGGPLEFCEAHGKEAVADYDPASEPVTIEPIAAPTAMVPATTTAIDKAIADELAAGLVDSQEALALVAAFEIKNADDFAFAEESRAVTKGQWKVYEAKRTKATGPLNASLKEINGWFKPVQTVLVKMEKIWDGKILQAKRAGEAEQARLLEAARQAEAPAEIRTALVAAAEAPPQPSSIQYRDHWVFEITDTSLVPRDFMCPDKEKIGHVASVLKDKTDIPGVRVWNDQRVAGPSKVGS